MPLFLRTMINTSENTYVYTSVFDANDVQNDDLDHQVEKPRKYIVQKCGENKYHAFVHTMSIGEEEHKI